MEKTEIKGIKMEKTEKFSKEDLNSIAEGYFNQIRDMYLLTDDLYEDEAALALLIRYRKRLRSLKHLSCFNEEWIASMLKLLDDLIPLIIAKTNRYYDVRREETERLINQIEKATNYTFISRKE